jgi:hypothetical protein
MATEHEQREALASTVHDLWAVWVEHFINNMTLENLLRWKSQADKEYSELSEEDKEKDREVADKILNTVRRYPTEDDE